MQDINQNWQEWKRRILWAVERVIGKGGEIITPLAFFLPVSDTQVHELKRETGLVLPDDFTQWMTQECGGFEFSWSLSEIDTPLGDWMYGGNSEVPFVGARDGETLLALYNRFQNEVRHTALYSTQHDHNPERVITRETLTQCFPLYGFYGGGGDYWALRCDVQPAQVLYLDHEQFYRPDGTAVVGVGFSPFMDTWTSLGCPEFDTYSLLLNEQTHLLDLAMPDAVGWLSWLKEA